MKTKLSTWYACTDEGGTVLHCAECDACVDLEYPSLDHHPAVCPKCGVECAFLNWKGRMLQIVPKKRASRYHANAALGRNNTSMSWSMRNW